MRVDELRPALLTERYFELHQSDVQTMLQWSESFVRVPCPACGAESHRERFRKSGFAFVECASCASLFVNPRPTPEQLLWFYTEAQSFALFQSEIFPLSEGARRRRIFGPRAARVAALSRRYLPGRPGVLFDVGAGFGTFAQEMARLTFFDRVVAVEPSPRLAEACRSRGIETIAQEIERATITDASVITSFELIEHLFDPRQFLLRCLRALSASGLLIVTTPSIRGFDLATLGQQADNIDGPEHLNYFHEDSLCALLRTVGFEIVEVSTPGELDAEIVRLKALAGQIDLSGQPFLKRILLDEWDRLGGPFQAFLATQRLSSHLWVVARPAHGAAGTVPAAQHGATPATKAQG